MTVGLHPLLRTECAMTIGVVFWSVMGTHIFTFGLEGTVLPTFHTQEKQCQLLFSSRKAFISP